MSLEGLPLARIMAGVKRYRSCVSGDADTTEWDACVTARLVKCHVGRWFERTGTPYDSMCGDHEECHDFYLRCRGRAENAAIAWMGCFRRGVLRFLSRDTATLIAKIIAQPDYWLFDGGGRGAVPVRSDASGDSGSVVP